MKDYQKGKIYKLYSVSNKDLVYYGSTTLTLNERLLLHINNYKINTSCTSKKVIAAGDYKMELIENYPCNNTAELTRREGEYTKANKCVNQKIPGRTRKEYKEDNKEKIAKQKKIWNENNKEAVTEQRKKYYENNKEAIAERVKKWRENNKEKIAEKQKAYNKVKVTCECGCIITRDSLAKHKQSNKHLELIEH